MTRITKIIWNPDKKEELRTANNAYKEASATLDKLLREINEKKMYQEWGYQDFRSMLEGELGDASMATKYVGDEPITTQQVIQEAQRRNVGTAQVLKDMFESGSIGIDRVLQLATSWGLRNKQI